MVDFSLWPLMLLIVLFAVGGVGFPLPEEAILLLAGLIAATQGLWWQTIAICALGIALGDTLAYIRGRIRSEQFRRFKHGQKFINRSGFFAVLMSRFFVTSRVIVPFMAGAMRMPRVRFHLASVLGAFVLSTVIVGAGGAIYLALPAEQAPLFYTLLVAVVASITVMYATRVQTQMADAGRGKE